MVLKKHKTILSILTILSIISCVPKGGSRSFSHEFEEFGWKMEMHEIDPYRNRFLDLCLQKLDNPDGTPIHIKLKNDVCVVRLIIVDGVDSVYVRYDRECFEAPDLAVPLPPNIPPERLCNVIGEMPSQCVKIPYSDSRFVVYDSKEHDYFPIADSIHVISIVHQTERANCYDILAYMTSADHHRVARWE